MLCKHCLRLVPWPPSDWQSRSRGTPVRERRAQTWRAPFSCRTRVDDPGPWMLWMKMLPSRYYYRENIFPISTLYVEEELAPPFGREPWEGTTNGRFAYVSVSRASHHAQIYTNSAATLAENLSRDVEDFGN